MMPHSEILDLLPQYCEGLLPASRAESVSAHLLECGDCRAACEDIRAGVETLRSLPANRLDAAASRRILDSVRRGARPQRAPSLLRWISAAAAVAAIVAGVLLFQSGRRIELKMETGKPSELETIALQMHRQRLEGSLALDFRTSSAGAARSWMAQHGGVVADIALERPVEDGGSYQLEGVRRIESNGHSAMLVAYRVDSHAVTLVAARSADFADHPPEAAFAKRIFFHSDASGQKVITWSISGQSYSLVSDLPGYGQQGCFLCHTEASRRAMIRNMAPT